MDLGDRQQQDQHDPVRRFHFAISTASVAPGLPADESRLWGMAAMQAKQILRTRHPQS